MPATPESEEFAPAETPALEAKLDDCARGDADESSLLGLADLTRADDRLLAERWPALSDETRITVARRLLELTEERVDLHFGRALRTLLSDRSPVVRQLAAAGLWEDEGVDLPDRLLRAAGDDASQDVVAQCLQSLAASADRAVMGDLDEATTTRVREGLLRIVSDPSLAALVRRRALESGAVFADDPRVTPLIEAFFEGDEPGFRASAIYAMGRTADRRWLPLVTEEFASDDAELRFEAARAAGELGSTDTLPGLLDLAQDEDVEVRQVAIGAIGRIGGRAAVRTLQHLAEDAPESDGETIEEALLEAETSLDPLTLDR